MNRLYSSSDVSSLIEFRWFSTYYPVVCEGRSPEEIQRMEEENALPHGWENMPYEDFLIECRKLMAAKIKAAFEQLKKNVE